ncbi:MAG: DUF4271 domain-containing protein [Muribaculaceae bacterium]|nr:DUF4271 domain-containing protein [Muribaculaceae bacterium]
MTLLTAAIGLNAEPSGVHTPDNIILSVILALFVVMGLNAPNLRHITTSFFSDLVSRRQRANIFDIHNTAADARMILLMMIQTSVFEGVLLAGWVTADGSANYQLCVAVLTGVAVVFNTFCYLACATLGYVFTTPENAGLWRHTFSTSQGLLGIGLLIPATISVLWAGDQSWAYISAIILYVVARMCYIFKGISFFYNNVLSSFYFILYLCALEIIPVLAVVHTAVVLSTVL